MKYSAVIFDLDGTIINSMPVWKKAVKELLQNKGINLNIEMETKLTKKTTGLGIKETFVIIKEAFNMTDTIETLIDEQVKIAHKIYKQEVCFIDGFLDFHNKLKKRQLKNGIATNGNRNSLGLAKNTFNLEKFFGNHIYCVSDVNDISKPAPDLFLHAAKKLGVQPSKCIVIEDSIFGIKAAKKAGMFCIGINTGNNLQLINEADFIVEKYEDINLDTILT